MRSWLEGVLVFAAALAVRLAFLAEVHGTPITQLLLIDSATYDRFAKLILSGGFRGEAVYSMNILYPYFLAGVYLVTGQSPDAVRILQAVLGALNCALVFALGARLFGRRAAWTAGLLAAFYPPGIFYTATLLTPVLIETCCLGTLLLLYRWLDTRRVLALVAAGLALGLAALGRGNSFLLVPFALLFFRSSAGTWRAALRPWAVFAGAAAWLLVLVLVRNFWVEREFVPVSANYAAFYIGHNPEATGLYTMPDFTETAAFEGEVLGTREALSRSEGRNLNLAEASSVLFDRGVGYLLGHPGAEAKLTLRKLYYFWNRTESPTNLNFHLAQDYSRILRRIPLGFGVIAPLALLGIFLSRRRARELLLLYLYASVYLVTCLLFFVSAEYRMPVVPVLLVFAGYALVRLGELARGSTGRGRARTRAAGALAGALLLLAPLAFACNVRDHRLSLQSLKRVDYYNLATLYKQQNDLDNAEAMLRRALAIDPAYPLAYASLAELELLRGNGDEASRYAALARRYGGPAAAGSDLDRTRVEAEQLYLAGNYEQAEERFVALRDRYREAGNADSELSMMNNLGLCRYKLEQYEAAEATFREVISRDAGYVRAYNNLALVCEATGRTSEATEAYRTALRLDPGNRKAAAALARLTGGKP